MAAKDNYDARPEKQRSNVALHRQRALRGHFPRPLILFLSPLIIKSTTDHLNSFEPQANVTAKPHIDQASGPLRRHTLGSEFWVGLNNLANLHTVFGLNRI